MIIKKYESGHSLVPDDGDTVHMRALNYVKKNPGCDYRFAVLEVLRADAALARKYYGRSEEPKESTEGCIEARSYTQAKAELHDQAMELKVARGIGYTEALHEVMSLPKNRLLVQKYVANSAKRSFESY